MNGENLKIRVHPNALFVLAGQTTAAASYLPSTGAALAPQNGLSDLEYLGNGSFSSGSMYSVGGFGGYAVDDSTVLTSSTHGAVGGKIGTELWEGGL